MTRIGLFYRAASANLKQKSILQHRINGDSKIMSRGDRGICHHSGSKTLSLGCSFFLDPVSRSCTSLGNMIREGMLLTQFPVFQIWCITLWHSPVILSLNMAPEGIVHNGGSCNGP